MEGPVAGEAAPVVLTYHDTRTHNRMRAGGKSDDVIPRTSYARVCACVWMYVDAMQPDGDGKV